MSAFLRLGSCLYPGSETELSRSTWYRQPVKAPVVQVEEVVEGAIYSVAVRQAFGHLGPSPGHTGLSVESELLKDTPETPKVRILKGGTLTKLVHHLLEAFTMGDTSYVPAFLATFRVFTSVETVLKLLLDKLEVFEATRSMKAKGRESPLELHTAASSVFCSWMDWYPEDFRGSLDPALLERFSAYLTREFGEGSGPGRRRDSLLQMLEKLRSTNDALLGGSGSQETTSLGTLVDCWYVEEVKGHAGSFARGVSQRKAMMLLRDDVQRTKALDFTVPQDVEPGLFFDVIDPTRRLLNRKIRQQQVSEQRAGSFCEVSPFRPQAAFLDWALSLTPEQQSPPDLGGDWFTSILQDPQKTFSISSVHRRMPGPEGQQEQAKSTMVALNVFTNTPKLAARLGSKVVLDCAFSAMKDDRFSVEWRYQFQGSGHVVYAYDGVTDRILVAQEGAEIFFQELHRHGNASLLLHDVRVKHEGTYLCIVYTPYLHVQQAVELRITEPPQVTLHPDPLYVVPGKDQVLECEAASYYPLDVTVEWLRRNGTAGEVEYLTGSWQSNHRASPDGTFTLSSYVRVWGDPKEHGAQYTCYVSHPALKTGAKRSLRLSVAGESGPSMEDTIGLFITAFILCGLLTYISTKVSSWMSPSAGDVQSVKQKNKAE